MLFKDSNILVRILHAKGQWRNKCSLFSSLLKHITQTSSEIANEGFRLYLRLLALILLKTAVQEKLVF